MNIGIELHPKGLAAKPLGYLQPGEFAMYRDACHEARARFEASTKLQVLPFANLATLTRALKVAGFEVTVAPEIAARVSTTRVDVDAMVAEAKARHAIVMKSGPWSPKPRPATPS